MEDDLYVHVSQVTKLAYTCISIHRNFLDNKKNAENTCKPQITLNGMLTII